jgi:hypothetical protein
MSACTEDKSDQNILGNTQVIETPASFSQEVTPATQVSGITQVQPDPELILKVDKLAMTIDDTGAIQVMGLLYNHADRAVSNVQINIQILDNLGNVLATEKTGVLLEYIHPGGTWPFLFDIQGKHPLAKQAIANVEKFSYPDLETASVQTQNETLRIEQEKFVFISGEIYNSTLGPVLIDCISAAIFDKEGGVIFKSGEYKSIGYLDPGETGPYQVRLLLPQSSHKPIVDFQVYVEARISPPLRQMNIEISDHSNSFIDRSNVFHLVGEITNKQTKPVKISLIAAVYDSEDDLLDVATFTLPLPLSSEETLPYHFDRWELINIDSDIRERAVRYTIQWDPASSYFVDASYVPLSIIEEGTQSTLSSVSFRGKIVNDTEFRLRKAIIVTVIYDKETQNIIAVGYLPLEDMIDVHEMIPYDFNINVDGINQKNSFDVVIMGRGELSDSQ